MQSHWFLSQFYTPPSLGHLVPVCIAYGGQWMAPTFPTGSTDFALVYMKTTPMQMDAAKADPRVIVMPYMFDPSAVPTEAITAYASMGATAGMSIGALIATLAAAEPLYGSLL